MLTKTFEHPRVIFEVLSSTSGKRDRGPKMQAYQNIASVRLVVLVDPGERRFETYERVDDGEWAVGMPFGHDSRSDRPRLRDHRRGDVRRRLSG